MKIITDKDIKGISVHNPSSSRMKLLSMYWLQRNEEWKAKQYYNIYRAKGGKLLFSDLKRIAKIK